LAKPTGKDAAVKQIDLIHVWVYSTVVLVTLAGGTREPIIYILQGVETRTEADVLHSSSHVEPLASHHGRMPEK